jgi:hypothetical protein
MPQPTREELIRWGESQQNGNCLAPAKYRFVENNLKEVQEDYESFQRNTARQKYSYPVVQKPVKSFP